MNRFLILALLLASGSNAQTLAPVCEFDNAGLPVCLEPQADPIGTDLLERLADALPEQQNVNFHHPEFLDHTQVNLVLTDSADVWITFVAEGAGYRNSFGYYLFDPENPPRETGEIDWRWLVFPNASQAGSGGALLPGDRLHLGAFSAGTGIGWFLMADAWREGAVDPTRPTWFGEHLLNPETVRMAIQLHDVESDRVFVCFEDIRADTGGDRDYNDLVCAATVTPPEAVDWDDIEVLPDDEETVDVRSPERPSSCRIDSVHPNPFNPSTLVEWTLQETAVARLAVHDLGGREVAVLHEGLAAAGAHRTVFDAAGLPSGVYLCALETRDGLWTSKLVLLK